MDVLTLCVPWILAVLVLLTIILLFFKRWKPTFVVALIICVINWFFQVFAIGNIFNGSSNSQISLMSWNVNLSASDVYTKEKLISMANFIISENADVVFLTENYRAVPDTMTQMLHDYYPYYAIDYNCCGNIVYSKLPLSKMKGIPGAEYMIANSRCVVSCDGDSIALYCCHLASNNYDPNMNYMTPDSVESHHQAMSYVKNISHASKLREQECDSLIANINCFHGPIIVMGDMNDVCGSPCLRKFADAGFADAWWKGGFGYGATIHHPLPYRIDHILFRSSSSSECSERFGKVKNGLVLKSIKKIDAYGLSDHHALVAEFELR